MAILSFFEVLLGIFGVVSNYQLKASGAASVNVIQTPVTMMISDPILGWRIKPNSRLEFEGVEFVNNSYGFRGGEITQPKGEDVFRILCFGDSSTYGVFVPYEDIYSTKLKDKLRNHFKDMNFEVINAGVLGYTTLQILALLDRKLKSLEPDIIIVSAGTNDASIISEEQPEDSRVIPIYGDFFATFKYYAEHSRLISLLNRFFFKSSDPLAPLPLPQKFDETMKKRRVKISDYEENLIKIFEISSQLSAKTIFLAFSLPSSYQSVMEKVSKITGARYVDAEPALSRNYEFYKNKRTSPPSEMDYLMMADTYYENILGKERMKIRRDKTLFVDNIHPNSIGHEIIADTIFDTIVNDLLLVK